MNTVHLTMKGADTILNSLKSDARPTDAAMKAANEYRDGVNVSNKRASLEPKNLFDAMISARSDIDAFIASLPKRARSRPFGKPSIWYNVNRWQCQQLTPSVSNIGVGDTPLDAYKSWVKVGDVDDDFNEWYGRRKWQK